MAASRDKKVKQTIVLFVVTFLISLIVITYFIKSFSPNVDVEIGGDESQKYETESSDSDVKQAIDDRLRWIQMEDNMPGASKRDDSQGVDEESELEKVKQNTTDLKRQELENSQVNKLAPIDFVSPQSTKTQKTNKTASNPPVPTSVPVQAEPPKMSKVYVGSYATIEQAIQAQNRLMNTAVSVSPFVKEVNGSYVLQVGSYANAGKAEAIMREINSLGFSARIVKE